MIVRSRQSARQALLLDELVELFLADGFADLSMGHLASRLRCSKTTLYGLAPSKEQLIVAVVRRFFQRSTERVEAAVADAGSPSQTLRSYLIAISQQLAPATPAFFADLDAFPPAREIYTRNTAFAAKRVQELVDEAATKPPGHVTATFVGAVAGLVMEAIHRGQLERAAGLDDSAAYRALADLIVAGVGKG